MRPTASTFIHFLGHFFRTRFWDTFFCIFFYIFFTFGETFLGHLFCNFWYTFWDTCSTSQYHIWYPWSACFSQKLWILLSAPLGLGHAFYFLIKCWNIIVRILYIPFKVLVFQKFQQTIHFLILVTLWFCSNQIILYELLEYFILIILFC